MASQIKRLIKLRNEYALLHRNVKKKNQLLRSIMMCGDFLIASNGSIRFSFDRNSKEQPDAVRCNFSDVTYLWLYWY
jgi:hypothetical protein